MLKLAILDERERPAAERLERLVRAAWPGIDSAPDDFVGIAAGLRNVREIDLLVVFDLANPRRLGDESVYAGAIVIEAKGVDPQALTLVGEDIRPKYSGKSSRRTLLAQVDEAVRGLLQWRAPYDLGTFFLHGLGWLTEIPGATFDRISPRILGSDAGWDDILRAAAWQNQELYGPPKDGDVRRVRKMFEMLTREREITGRDRARADVLTNSILNRDVLDRLIAERGTKQLSLVGRAGSGKSTTLALLAKHAQAIDGDRVLLLTFHRALCNELEHLVRKVVALPGIVGRSIVVEPMMELLIAALDGLGGEVPRKDDGTVDYPKTQAAFGALRARLLAAGTAVDDVATLKELDPDRYGFDAVMIDEAQDWSDAERDFLRLLYRPEQLVIGNGLEQLIRRQSPCDWSVGVPKASRVNRELGRSLRMGPNVAQFVNAFARAMGMPDWQLKPHGEIAGGRVVVGYGEASADRALFESAFAAARANDAPLGDCLVCVPHSLVPKDRSPKTSVPGDDLRAWGFDVWDACDDAVRASLPESPDSVRIVQYDSARGLEGWVTIALALDKLYEQRLKYPNLSPGDDCTAEDVAKRWLLMALTRAAHMLVVTVDDPASPVAGWLREATAALPAGLVEAAP